MRPGTAPAHRRPPPGGTVSPAPVRGLVALMRAVSKLFTAGLAIASIGSLVAGHATRALALGAAGLIAAGVAVRVALLERGA